MDFKDFIRKYANEPWGNAQAIIKREVTTGDLAGILTDTLNKEARADYEEITPTWTAFVEERSQSDLKPAKVNAWDASFMPEDIPEGMEYKFSSPVSHQDQIALVKRGKAFKISEESLINDDLGVLSNIIGKFGRGMRRREAQLVYGLLTGSGTQVEGGNLFSTAHKNTVTPSDTSTISIKSIAQARLKMTLQKDMAGQAVNVSPR